MYRWPNQRNKKPDKGPVVFMPRDHFHTERVDESGQVRATLSSAGWKSHKLSNIQADIIGVPGARLFITDNSGYRWWSTRSIVGIANSKGRVAGAVVTEGLVPGGAAFVLPLFSTSRFAAPALVKYARWKASQALSIEMMPGRRIDIKVPRGWSRYRLFSIQPSHPHMPQSHRLHDGETNTLYCLHPHCRSLIWLARVEPSSNQVDPSSIVLLHAGCASSALSFDLRDVQPRAIRLQNADGSPAKSSHITLSLWGSGKLQCHGFSLPLLRSGEAAVRVHGNADLSSARVCYSDSNAVYVGELQGEAKGSIVANMTMPTARTITATLRGKRASPPLVRFFFSNEWLCPPCGDPAIDFKADSTQFTCRVAHNSPLVIAVEADGKKETRTIQPGKSNVDLQFDI